MTEVRRNVQIDIEGSSGDFVAAATTAEQALERLENRYQGLNERFQQLTARQDEFNQAQRELAQTDQGNLARSARLATRAYSDATVSLQTYRSHVRALSGDQARLQPLSLISDRELQKVQQYTQLLQRQQQQQQQGPRRDDGPSSDQTIRRLERQCEVLVQIGEKRDDIEAKPSDQLVLSESEAQRIEGRIRNMNQALNGLADGAERLGRLSREDFLRLGLDDNTEEVARLREQLKGIVGEAGGLARELRGSGDVVQREVGRPLESIDNQIGDLGRRYQALLPQFREINRLIEQTQTNEQQRFQAAEQQAEELGRKNEQEVVRTRENLDLIQQRLGQADEFVLRINQSVRRLSQGERQAILGVTSRFRDLRDDLNQTNVAQQFLLDALQKETEIAQGITRARAVFADQQRAAALSPEQVERGRQYIQDQEEALARLRPRIDVARNAYQEGTKALDEYGDELKELNRDGGELLNFYTDLARQESNIQLPGLESTERYEKAFERVNALILGGQTGLTNLNKRQLERLNRLRQEIIRLDETGDAQERLNEEVRNHETLLQRRRALQAPINLGLLNDEEVQAQRRAIQLLDRDIVESTERVHDLADALDQRDRAVGRILDLDQRNRDLDPLLDQVIEREREGVAIIDNNRREVDRINRGIAETRQRIAELHGASAEAAQIIAETDSSETGRVYLGLLNDFEQLADEQDRILENQLLHRSELEEEVQLLQQLTQERERYLASDRTQEDFEVFRDFAARVFLSDRAVREFRQNMSLIREDFEGLSPDVRALGDDLENFAENFRGLAQERINLEQLDLEAIDPSVRATRQQDAAAQAQAQAQEDRANRFIERLRTNIDELEGRFIGVLDGPEGERTLIDPENLALVDRVLRIARETLDRTDAGQGVVLITDEQRRLVGEMGDNLSALNVTQQMHNEQVQEAIKLREQEAKAAERTRVANLEASRSEQEMIGDRIVAELRAEDPDFRENERLEGLVRLTGDLVDLERERREIIARAENLQPVFDQDTANRTNVLLARAVGLYERIIPRVKELDGLQRDAFEAGAQDLSLLIERLEQVFRSTNERSYRDDNRLFNPEEIDELFARFRSENAKLAAQGQVQLVDTDNLKESIELERRLNEATNRRNSAQIQLERRQISFPIAPFPTESEQDQREGERLRELLSRAGDIVGNVSAFRDREGFEVALLARDTGMILALNKEIEQTKADLIARTEEQGESEGAHNRERIRQLDQIIKGNEVLIAIQKEFESGLSQQRIRGRRRFAGTIDELLQISLANGRVQSSLYDLSREYEEGTVAAQKYRDAKKELQEATAALNVILKEQGETTGQNQETTDELFSDRLLNDIDIARERYEAFLARPESDKELISEENIRDVEKILFAINRELQRTGERAIVDPDERRRINELQGQARLLLDAQQSHNKALEDRNELEKEAARVTTAVSTERIESLQQESKALSDTSDQIARRSELERNLANAERQVEQGRTAAASLREQAEAQGEYLATTTETNRRQQEYIDLVQQSAALLDMEGLEGNLEATTELAERAGRIHTELAQFATTLEGESRRAFQEYSSRVGQLQGELHSLVEAQRELAQQPARLETAQQQLAEADRRLEEGQAAPEGAISDSDFTRLEENRQRAYELLQNTERAADRLQENIEDRVIGINQIYETFQAESDLAIQFGETAKQIRQSTEAAMGFRVELDRINQSLGQQSDQTSSLFQQAPQQQAQSQIVQRQVLQQSLSRIGAAGPSGPTGPAGPAGQGEDLSEQLARARTLQAQFAQIQQEIADGVQTLSDEERQQFEERRSQLNRLISAYENYARNVDLVADAQKDLADAQARVQANLTEGDLSQEELDDLEDNIRYIESSRLPRNIEQQEGALASLRERLPALERAAEFAQQLNSPQQAQAREAVGQAIAEETEQIKENTQAKEESLDVDRESVEQAVRLRDTLQAVREDPNIDRQVRQAQRLYRLTTRLNEAQNNIELSEEERLRLTTRITKQISQQFRELTRGINPFETVRRRLKETDNALVRVNEGIENINKIGVSPEIAEQFDDQIRTLKEAQPLLENLRQRYQELNEAANERNRIREQLDAAQETAPDAPETAALAQRLEEARLRYRGIVDQVAEETRRLSGPIEGFSVPDLSPEQEQFLQRAEANRQAAEQAAAEATAAAAERQKADEEAARVAAEAAEEEKRQAAERAERDRQEAEALERKRRIETQTTEAVATSTAFRDRQNKAITEGISQLAVADDLGKDLVTTDQRRLLFLQGITGALRQHRDIQAETERQTQEAAEQARRAPTPFGRPLRSDLSAPDAIPQIERQIAETTSRLERREAVEQALLDLTREQTRATLERVEIERFLTDRDISDLSNEQLAQLTERYTDLSRFLETSRAESLAIQEELAEIDYATTRSAQLLQQLAEARERQARAEQEATQRIDEYNEKEAERTQLIEASNQATAEQGGPQAAQAQQERLDAEKEVAQVRTDGQKESIALENQYTDIIAERARQEDQRRREERRELRALERPVPERFLASDLERQAIPQLEANLDNINTRLEQRQAIEQALTSLTEERTQATRELQAIERALTGDQIDSLTTRQVTFLSERYQDLDRFIANTRTRVAFLNEELAELDYLELRRTDVAAQASVAGAEQTQRQVREMAIQAEEEAQRQQAEANRRAEEDARNRNQIEGQLLGTLQAVAQAAKEKAEAEAEAARLKERQIELEKDLGTIQEEINQKAIDFDMERAELNEEIATAKENIAAAAERELNASSQFDAQGQREQQARSEQALQKSEAALANLNKRQEETNTLAQREAEIREELSQIETARAAQTAPDPMPTDADEPFPFDEDMAEAATEAVEKDTEAKQENVDVTEELTDAEKELERQRNRRALYSADLEKQVRTFDRQSRAARDFGEILKENNIDLNELSMALERVRTRAPGTSVPDDLVEFLGSTSEVSGRNLSQIAREVDRITQSAEDNTKAIADQIELFDQNINKNRELGEVLKENNLSLRETNDLFERLRQREPGAAVSAADQEALQQLVETTGRDIASIDRDLRRMNKSIEDSRRNLFSFTRLFSRFADFNRHITATTTALAAFLVVTGAAFAITEALPAIIGLVGVAAGVAAGIIANKYTRALKDAEVQTGITTKGIQTLHAATSQLGFDVGQTASVIASAQQALANVRFDYGGESQAAIIRLGLDLETILSTARPIEDTLADISRATLFQDFADRRNLLEQIFGDNQQLIGLLINGDFSRALENISGTRVSLRSQDFDLIADVGASFNRIVNTAQSFLNQFVVTFGVPLLSLVDKVEERIPQVAAYLGEFFGDEIRKLDAGFDDIWQGTLDFLAEAEIAVRHLLNRVEQFGSLFSTLGLSPTAVIDIASLLLFTNLVTALIAPLSKVVGFIASLGAGFLTLRTNIATVGLAAAIGPKGWIVLGLTAIAVIVPTVIALFNRFSEAQEKVVELQREGVEIQEKTIDGYREIARLSGQRREDARARFIIQQTEAQGKFIEALILAQDEYEQLYQIERRLFDEASGRRRAFELGELSPEEFAEEPPGFTESNDLRDLRLQAEAARRLAQENAADNDARLARLDDLIDGYQATADLENQRRAAAEAVADAEERLVQAKERNQTLTEQAIEQVRQIQRLGIREETVAQRLIGSDRDFEDIGEIFRRADAFDDLERLSRTNSEARAIQSELTSLANQMREDGTLVVEVSDELRRRIAALAQAQGGALADLTANELLQFEVYVQTVLDLTGRSIGELHQAYQAFQAISTDPAAALGIQETIDRVNEALQRAGSGEDVDFEGLTTKIDDALRLIRENLERYGDLSPLSLIEIEGEVEALRDALGQADEAAQTAANEAIVASEQRAGRLRTLFAEFISGYDEMQRRAELWARVQLSIVQNFNAGLADIITGVSSISDAFESFTQRLKRTVVEALLDSLTSGLQNRLNDIIEQATARTARRTGQQRSEEDVIRLFGQFLQNRGESASDAEIQGTVRRGGATGQGGGNINVTDPDLGLGVGKANTGAVFQNTFIVQGGSAEENLVRAVEATQEQFIRSPYGRAAIQAANQEE